MFPAPNPVEFYLFSAFKNLENIKVLEQEVAKDYGKVNALLLKEFQFCIFLTSAVEAFLNQIIPNNFVYNDKKINVSKKEIERYWSIENKIKKAVPQITDINITSDSTRWGALLSLIKLRNDIIHLKTISQSSDFKSYQELYKELLDHNYELSYAVVTYIIKTIGTAQPTNRQSRVSFLTKLVEWFRKIISI